MAGKRLDLDLDHLRTLEGEVQLSELFDVLSDEYARYTLYHLADQPSTTLERLTAVVAGIEATVTGAAVTLAAHGRIRIRLSHAVLPKLDELGYLEFDREDRTITRVQLSRPLQQFRGGASGLKERGLPTPVGRTTRVGRGGSRQLRHRPGTVATLSPQR